ncbi:heavy-metal-associated domain-containing protein [Proteiniborus sp.]|uniref:heavy-metal-associated domain-containing protein n=1 Tax=Proteiniborus sp. TaxID=2079015 RepID=UPI0033179B1F
MKKVTLQLEELTCPSCVKKIENALTTQFGVEEVKILFNSSKVKVNYDENEINADTIEKVVSNLGFDVLSKK